MAQYADCYCLIDSRDSRIGLLFLEQFLPNRKEASVDYPVPLYSDSPRLVFTNLTELISFLDREANEEYSIYWNNTNEKSSLKHGMFFYTNDGKIIIGFSVVGNSPEHDLAIHYFKDVKHFLKSEIGCITIEEKPPLNSLEFKEFCKHRFVPK